MKKLIFISAIAIIYSACTPAESAPEPVTGNFNREVSATPGNAAKAKMVHYSADTTRSQASASKIDSVSTPTKKAVVKRVSNDIPSNKVNAADSVSAIGTVVNDAAGNTKKEKGVKGLLQKLKRDRDMINLVGGGVKNKED